MHPEIKHQLYGGDIADYYPAKQQTKSLGEDNKDLSNIYNNCVANKNKFTAYLGNMARLDKHPDTLVPRQ